MAPRRTGHTGTSTGMQNFDLLPPSAFESKRTGDPWKELARATGELMQLRLDNQQLRDQNKLSCGKAEEIRARVDIHRSASDTSQTKHVDELVQRQAAEICDLKTELRTLQVNHKQQTTEHEKELTFKEIQYSHTVSSLEAELRSREDNYEAQVDRLSREHESEARDLAQRVDQLEGELENTKTSYTDKIFNLRQELQSLTDKSQAKISDLEQTLRTKDSTIDNLQIQVGKLKKYVGESEMGPTPTEVWKKEKNTFEKKINTLETEKESLQSTIHLLNIRLSSMNEILSLQETELSKAKTESADKNKLENALLTRWREKVFSLLVQQKSSEIVVKKDHQKWKQMLNDTKNIQDSYKNKVEVLTHSLSDRQAQLEIEHNNNKVLQEDLTNAQHIAISLDDQLSGSKQHAETLRLTLEQFQDGFAEMFKTFHVSMDTMKTYGQRISFATGRLEMLQGQFVRREARIRLELTDARRTPAERESEGQDRSAAEHSRVMEIHIQEELEMVSRERDSLAAQLREDAELMEGKVASARHQVESEVMRLRSSVAALERSVQEKSEKCAQLSSHLESAQAELEESCESVERLKIELGKQQLETTQAIKDQESDLQAQFSEQLAELDRKRNEAKREHAKAVVSLRQIERQSVREKERTEEQGKLREEHYTRQVDKLQKQVHGLEKERNLMMATLRQEGLLGSVKRSEPVLLEEGSVREVTREVNQGHAHTEGGAVETISTIDLSGSGVADEPISAVLDDLRGLTAAVLGEEEDDSPGNSSNEN